MKKIGIMGGTFNPIHYGHLILAETALCDFKLDEILVIPTKLTYYKENDYTITENDRINMVELAINSNKKFKFSKIDLERQGYTYTVDTLSEITNKNPNNEYYFIMGQDSLKNFETWREPEKILNMAKILVAIRNDCKENNLDENIKYLFNKYNAEIYKLRIPSIEISSTDIRNRVKIGRSIKYLLPDTVENYIKKNNLYI